MFFLDLNISKLHKIISPEKLEKQNRLVLPIFPIERKLLFNRLILNLHKTFQLRIKSKTKLNLQSLIRKFCLTQGPHILTIPLDAEEKKKSPLLDQVNDHINDSSFFNIFITLISYI